MVRSSPTKEQTMSVLPIVGMGGVGKTSLARRVFNEEHIVSHFGKRIWVHVSANFEPDTVFKNILGSLMQEGNNVGAREQDVLQSIQDKLRHKTYLLVLDDVWCENAIEWDSFNNSLDAVSFGKGNVVIITTRIEKIIHLITEPLGVHKLGMLSNDDCWRIIKANANLQGGGYEIEAIGKSLAARCRGLPLAALVIGCWLDGRSPEEWVSIESKWISDLGNPISTVLKLSFDNLSTPALKKCFAYTAIIPKGHCAEKEELIELWMAEGLLQGHQASEMEMEDAGKTILNELVQSSLLQVWERDHLTGDAKKLGMHDLVADLALSVLDDGSHQCRYLFSGSSPDQIEHAKHLRTLFLRGNISDGMLPKLLWLHTLILDGEDITELPVSIGKLIHLKYLDTANTRIETLPESIGKLYLFQTLRATAEHGGRSSLRKLPVAFKYLISLRHLHIPNIELPPEVGKLTSLQTLPYFPVGDEEGRRIVELGKLTNLGGELEISNLEKVGDMQEAERADLFHKPKIYKLKLVWKNEGESSYSSFSDDKNVLEGLKPHPNLKSLEIHGFKGTSFPTWTMKMAIREERLDKLIHLKLSHCQECEEIPMLGQLPHLKYLILSHLTNVKSIGPSFYGITGNEATASVFPELQRLELMGLQNLRVWEEVKSSSSSSSSLVFPRLEVLVITKCRRLESAPSEFPCLKEFEIFSVESPLPLANICGSKSSTLRKLKIWKVDGLVSLPDGLFSRNPDLSEATIRQCQSFTHLGSCGASSSLRKLTVQFCLNLTEFADVASLDALEELDLHLCPNLRSIPYSCRSKSGSSLRKLNIEACSGLTSLPIEMIETCAPTLEMFWLRKSQQQLMQMSILQKMPRLTILGYEIPEQTTDVDACMPTLHSVSQLTIYGAGKNAIPESLQYFTSLHCLSLNEFGMEALPEWLGSLPSLKTLYLCACPKLRCLPSFNNLVDLSIDHCPLLTKALEQPRIDVPHSEWSKISHIPNIRLDFQPITQQATTSAPVLLDFFKIG